MPRGEIHAGIRWEIREAAVAAEAARRKLPLPPLRFLATRGRCPGPRTPSAASMAVSHAVSPATRSACARAPQHSGHETRGTRGQFDHARRSELAMARTCARHPFTTARVLHSALGTVLRWCCGRTAGGARLRRLAAILDQLELGPDAHVQPARLPRGTYAAAYPGPGVCTKRALKQF